MPDNATPEVSEETMDQLREATAQQAVIARSTYSPRERCYTDVSGESIVQQSHKDACDIRNILKDYDKTGLIRHVNQAMAHFGDFTEVQEYAEALRTVKYADELFMTIPAKIRAFFQNDPNYFVEFCTNPENREQLVQLGLAEPIEAMRGREMMPLDSVPKDNKEATGEASTASEASSDASQTD